MQYEHVEALAGLERDRLISRRKHPRFPLFIHNYTERAQRLPIRDWPEPLKDCRGLILDESGDVVARAFRKFWNYEQVAADAPAHEPFTVWEKVDGSLGIVCTYRGERVVATRGSFESDQALWAAAWLDNHHARFTPEATYLFEIVYPDNRIVVDYGDTEDLFLLAVMDESGKHLDQSFEEVSRFRKARRFDGIADFSTISAMEDLVGQEGLVVRWRSGFMAKLKLDEYKRIHRLITQCSSRTIWELLRSGKGTAELMERVPSDFEGWARQQIDLLAGQHADITAWAKSAFAAAPQCENRKQFAEFAKQQKYPGLLFLLLDGRTLDEAIWKLIEPQWATPFRAEDEA